MHVSFIQEARGTLLSFMRTGAHFFHKIYSHFHSHKDSDTIPFSYKRCAIVSITRHTAFLIFTRGQGHNTLQ
jgi:hypothetical protein